MEFINQFERFKVEIYEGKEAGVLVEELASYIFYCN